MLIAAITLSVVLSVALVLAVHSNRILGTELAEERFKNQNQREIIAGGTEAIAKLEAQIVKLTPKLPVKRDRAGSALVPASWEEVTAAYAANPDNYKEQA